LLKHTVVRIAFTTKNNLERLLTSHRHDQDIDIYNNNGVYQMTCQTCHTKYIGQTGIPFRTRFKEHEQDYRHNNNKSLYAKHLLDYNHPFHSIDNSMHILHTAGKGRLLNVIENFYIHKETAANNQLNDRMTTTPNILFDVIHRPPTQHRALPRLSPTISSISAATANTPTPINTLHRSTIRRRTSNIPETYIAYAADLHGYNSLTTLPRIVRKHHTKTIQ
jgi:hypothetical protein